MIGGFAAGEQKLGTPGAHAAVRNLDGELHLPKPPYTRAEPGPCGDAGTDHQVRAKTAHLLRVDQNSPLAPNPLYKTACPRGRHHHTATTRVENHHCGAVRENMRDLERITAAGIDDRKPLQIRTHLDRSKQTETTHADDRRVLPGRSHPRQQAEQHIGRTLAGHHRSPRQTAVRKKISDTTGHGDDIRGLHCSPRDRTDPSRDLRHARTQVGQLLLTSGIGSRFTILEHVFEDSVIEHAAWTVRLAVATVAAVWSRLRPSMYPQRMADQDDHVKVTELRDELGQVVRVPTALLRSGPPPAFFDNDIREKEAAAAATALSSYSPEQIAPARAWSRAITAGLDNAIAAGAA